MKKRTPPIEKNDMLELPIQGFTADGQGVGRVEGYAVFVAGALPGEVVRAHVIKAGSGYGVAKLITVLQANPNRVVPPCSAFSRCGGCALQHCDYPAQLEAKTEQVRDALSRLGGFSAIQVEHALGMVNPWRYRNKGSFPAAGEGEVQIGFFAPHSHRLVALEDCLIQDERVMAAALAVRDWARQCNVQPYKEETHSGILRHAMARASKGGEVIAVVVTTGELPYKEALIKILCSRVPGLTGIVHNKNPQASNVIMGESYETIWGSGWLDENICGLQFRVSAGSFLQVNPLQTAVLYNTALSLLALRGDETVADVYCGIGTISLLLAQRAKRVIGIENVTTAVADARRNALANGLSNVEFLCAPAEEALPALVASGLQPDVIVLDPPRKGCDRAALTAILKSGAPRLLYISCDPATMARDCRILSEDGGYTLRHVQPVDMFPHTSHVETVVLMSQLKD